MSVLVTGGAGYIGSHMVLGLLDRGEKVVVCDDLSRGNVSLIPKGVRFYQQDVGDKAAMTRILQDEDVESVIHFAGYVVVPESVSDPALYYEKNTLTSLRLADACLAANVPRIIFSSTAAVYGDASNAPVDEAHPLNPVSPYGRSKLMTEVMLRDIGNSDGLRSVCLRYFNVAGADPAGRSGQSSSNATHLIKVMSQVATGKREFITIFGNDYPTRDGTCVRDYIHVTDLIDAHYLALLDIRRGVGAHQKIYNCGYGVGASVLEVLGCMEESIGTPLSVRMGDRRAGDPPMVVAESSAIRRDFGWRPQFADLPTIIRTALDWERTLPSAPPA